MRMFIICSATALSVLLPFETVQAGKRCRPVCCGPTTSSQVNGGVAGGAAVAGAAVGGLTGKANPALFAGAAIAGAPGGPIQTLRGPANPNLFNGNLGPVANPNSTIGPNPTTVINTTALSPGLVDASSQETWKQLALLQAKLNPDLANGQTAFDLRQSTLSTANAVTTTTDPKVVAESAKSWSN